MLTLNGVPALTFADLCQRAYREGPSFATRQGCEVLLGAVAGRTCLAFRGSLGGLDWLTDGRFCPWHDRYSGLWYPRGFLIGARSMWGLIGPAAWLRDGAYLTGHSKGAAEAYVFAAHMLAAGLRVHGIVTFGSPRPGLTSGLAERLCGIPKLRIVNRGDQVTDVPPWWLGFYHVGGATKVGKGWDIALDHPMEAYRKSLA